MRCRVDPRRTGCAFADWSVASVRGRVACTVHVSAKCALFVIYLLTADVYSNTVLRERGRVAYGSLYERLVQNITFCSHAMRRDWGARASPL